MTLSIRVSVACPESLIQDARHLAMVIAFGPEDANTYEYANWADAQDNRYSCASFPCNASWFSAAQSPLTRPSWDLAGSIDMEAAARAQTLLRLGAKASPSVIAVGVGTSGPEVLANMGVHPIEVTL